MVRKGNCREDNRGFSLLEILIGIMMLAILILPIIKTFATSSIINRDSRHLMIQTEVAQAIMEGFADKNYLEVRESMTKVISNTDVVSVNRAFSPIDENLFNTAGSYIGYPMGGNMASHLSNVKPSNVTWEGSSLPTHSFVSGNGVITSMNQVFANDIATTFQAHNMLAGHEDDRMMTSWYSNDRAALFIAYGNIHYGGYRFDAVVSFLPMAEHDDDTYYTYKVFLTLYEYKSDYTIADRFQHPLMTMESGIMSGRMN